MVSIGFVYFCSVIKNNYELQNDGTMKNILSKRTFIVLPLFLFSLHPLWGQKSNFKNDICIPGKLYMLSDIRNDVFVEALIKRWRPYNDFVRFSGDCVYSRKLNRVASVDTPVDGSNMKIELVNSDEFEIIKEKAISICVGKKGIGTQEVTVQILGDSFVNGAFFRDALLSKNYIPGIKLVGLRNIKNEEGQYDEGRGGWTVKKYFEIIPVAQQYGITQWCATDAPGAPGDSNWRGGEPVGLWDSNYNRKHTYAGFADGLAGK